MTIDRFGAEVKKRCEGGVGSCVRVFDGDFVGVRAKKKAGKNGKLGINPVFPAYVLSFLKDKHF